jgi:hypothetical protein
VNIDPRSSNGGTRDDILELLELRERAKTDLERKHQAFALLSVLECHSACNFDPLSRGIGVQN